MEKPQKRPRGRPGAPLDQRRRASLTLRIRDQTKAKMERLAEERGFSLSELAERILDDAMESELRLDQALDFAYGRELAGVVVVMADAMRAAAEHPLMHITRRERLSWTQDPWLFWQVLVSALRTIAAFRPPGSVADARPHPTSASFFLSHPTTKEFRIALESTIEAVENEMSLGRTVVP